MDEEEAKRAYEEISELLRKAELEWVVAQVEDSIDLEKAVTTKADASEFIDDKVAGQRCGDRRMQEFVTTQPYSHYERLNLLLDAIDRVMALPQFAAATLTILEADKVTFSSEQEGDDGYSLRGDSGERHEAARRRLEEVRQQIGDVSA